MDVEKAIQSAKETRYTPTGEFGTFVPQRAWSAILEALSRQKAAGEAMRHLLGEFTEWPDSELVQLCLAPAPGEHDGEPVVAATLGQLRRATLNSIGADREN